MPNTLRSSWTIQPPVPVGLDFSNPLTRNLTRVVVFDQGFARDLITGERLTQVSTGFSGAVTTKGKGLKNTNETSYWTMPIRTELAQHGSFGWVGSCQGGTTQIGMRDSSNAFGTIMFWRNSGWDLRLGGTAAATDYTAAGTFNLNTGYAACVTASATAGRIYVDGRLVLNGGAPVALGTAGTLFTPWVIHQNGTSAQGGLFTSQLLVIWDRPLLDQEAKSFSANPWQLFLPQNRGYIVASQPTAGGGGTTYTIVPSGGVVLSGVGIEINGKFFTPSGGFAMGGDGSITFSSGGTTYTITPTGGVTFGGTGNFIKGKFFIPSGGVGISGSSDPVDTKVIIPSGGVLFGGTGSMTSNVTPPSSGVSTERTKVGVGT